MKIDRFSEVFTDEALEKLLNISLPSDLETEVIKLLGKHHTHLNLDEAILADYYVSGLWWAIGRNFDSGKLHAFIAILENQITNINRQLSILEHMEEMKKSLENQEIFKEQELKDMVDYFIISIYEPYKLYEFIFNEDQFTLKLDGNFLLRTPQRHAFSLNESLSVEDYITISKEQSAKIQIKVEGKQVEEQLTEEILETIVQAEPEYLLDISKEKILEAIDEAFKEIAPNVEEELISKLEDKKITLLNKINVMNIMSDFKF